MKISKRYLYHRIKIFFKHLLGRTSITRIQLNNWLSSISINTNKVLEIGAGKNPVIQRVNKWKTKEYKTLDNNQQGMCNPDFEIDLNSLMWSDTKGWVSKNHNYQRALKEVLKYKPNILFCLEVMEYLYKPETILKFFYDILLPKGILYISFHFIYPVHEPYEYDSLRYTEQGVINLLKEAGFKRIYITKRIATKGRESLKRFFYLERMHQSKSKKVDVIGNFVKAIK